MQEQNIISNFIGAKPGVTKKKWIEYAWDILRKEMLPHTGINNFYERKNTYFLDYMMHRLLISSFTTGIINNKHYSKRLDLAGSLLAFLFLWLVQENAEGNSFICYEIP